MLVSVLLFDDETCDVDLPYADRLPDWRLFWEAWPPVMFALTVFGRSLSVCALGMYVARCTQLCWDD